MTSRNIWPKMSLSAYSPKSSWGTVMSPAEYLEQFSYEGGSTHIATAFGNNGYEVSTHIHSHPSNTKQPSGMEDGATSGDVKFAQSLDAITGGGTKFFIFIPENQSLIPYRGKSVPGDFTEDKLQQIKLDDYIKTR